MAGRNAKTAAAAHKGGVREALVNLWFEYLRDIACTKIEWHGLPDSINPFYLEKALFDGGKAIFFNETKNGKARVLRGGTINLDFYNYPSGAAVANHVMQKMGLEVFTGDNEDELEKDNEAVVCYNTPFMLPSWRSCLHYAEELAEVDLSIHTNLINMKMSRIFEVESEDERAQIEAMSNAVANGKPAVFIRGSMWKDRGNTPVWATPTEFITPQLNDARNAILARFYAENGIRCITTDKRERLTAAEGSVDEESVMLARQRFLLPRQWACDRLKKIFPDKYADVSVSWRIDAIKEEAKPNEQTDDRFFDDVGGGSGDLGGSEDA